MSQWVSGIPVILLNADVPTDRKRLTAAHELGHLVMHSEEVVENPEEQANEFAAEFLMPFEVIKPQLRGLRIEKLPHLKLQWGVSMAALVERTYRSGLMRPEERTRIYKIFSARGWRKKEPGSDQLPPEIPTLTGSIHAALAGRGLADDEIAKIAGFARPEDNRLYQGDRPRHRSV
jgi:Zn-dependent peptidase ImmA (M78 family)